MYLIIGTVLVVSLGFITMTGATPVRVSREASPPSITVVQTPKTDLTASQTDSTTLRECVPVSNSLVPTEVKLGPGSYRMRAFPSGCPVQDETKGVPMSIHDSVTIVNPRTQICSFKLGKPPAKGVTVRFSGEFSTTGMSQHEINVNDSKSCVNLCASSISSWTRYPQKVELLLNKKVANNHIDIFSDSGCEHKIRPEVKVKHGANLVQLTRTEPEVNSFVVYRK